MSCQDITACLSLSADWWRVSLARLAVRIVVHIDHKGNAGFRAVGLHRIGIYCLDLRTGTSDSSVNLESQPLPGTVSFDKCQYLTASSRIRGNLPAGGVT